MDIQWYPGHMTKARRAMTEDVKLVDRVVELVDARMPMESRNPDILKMAGDKGGLVVMCKEDLADPEATARFTKAFAAQGIRALAMDARTRSSMTLLRKALEELGKETAERNRKRGIVGRPVRVMIAGIPNVGKSTLINSMAGRSAAKTGNKPGVTRGRQWISLSRDLQLLDTPGILWPKFEDPTVGLHLAMIGSINDQILDETELALALLKLLLARYPSLLHQRYAGLTGEDFDEFSHLDEETRRALGCLREIALLRGYVMKGAEPDYSRCARAVLDDFRSGRLGRITLESVPLTED